MLKLFALVRPTHFVILFYFYFHFPLSVCVLLYDFNNNNNNNNNNSPGRVAALVCRQVSVTLAAIASFASRPIDSLTPVRGRCVFYTKQRKYVINQENFLVTAVNEKQKRTNTGIGTSVD